MKNLKRIGGLRPFFRHLGGKWRVAKRYPSPLHDVVVEPFAGGAGYSHWHWQKKVILWELDEKLQGLWAFLIRSSPADIMGLPINVDHVDDVHACPEAKDLVAKWFYCGGHSGTKARPQGGQPDYSWGSLVRSRIASQVDKIKHWEIHLGSYEGCPNQEATWHIDPPYQRSGIHYDRGSKAIDYGHLGRWCEDRLGQVMVCEQAGATWLPFRPFLVAQAASSQGRASKSYEVIWTNGG